MQYTVQKFSLAKDFLKGDCPRECGDYILTKQYFPRAYTEERIEFENTFIVLSASNSLGVRGEDGRRVNPGHCCAEGL